MKKTLKNDRFRVQFAIVKYKRHGEYHHQKFFFIQNIGLSINA